MISAGGKLITVTTSSIVFSVLCSRHCVKHHLIWFSQKPHEACVFYSTLQRRKLRFSEITLEAYNGSKWGSTDWIHVCVVLGQPTSQKSECLSSKIDKSLGEIMYMEIYASSILSKNTLRRADVPIIVMIILTSSLQNALELTKHIQKIVK